MMFVVVFSVVIPIIFASHALCFIHGYDCGVEDTQRVYEAILKARREGGEENG